MAVCHMCRWVAIIPGMTMPPVASISAAPSGASRSGPTAVSVPPATRTSARSRTSRPSPPGATIPPRSTKGRPRPEQHGLMSALRSILHTATLPSGRQTVNHLTRPDDAVAESRQRTTVRLTAALRGGPAFQVTGEQGSRMTDDTERDGPGGPLAGLLVADFSRILAGPYATMLLADLGAEVIKVEGPRGDDTRSWTPPARGEVSTYYLGVNRGKRSIALDLRDERDARAARELARRADVLIENFKPGGIDRKSTRLNSSHVK